MNLSDDAPIWELSSRVREVRETLRKDMICPKSSVLGGAHRYMGLRCPLCGHEPVFTGASVGAICDLLYELEVLRSDFRETLKEFRGSDE